jgi:hypothetical protein
MDEQSTHDAETGKKGAGSIIRTIVVYVGIILIAMTFFMAIYRKFGG